MSGLKLYYDLMSQPSRAIYLFLKINDIPFTDKLLALRKGEHFTPEYTKINPFNRVPVIDDSGFILTESVAILKYLSRAHTVPDNWYPQDVYQQARVDEYMAWQHENTRQKSVAIFQLKVIEPRQKQIPVNQEKLDKFRSELETTLDHLQNIFLRDRQYLCGDNISIADLLGVCELMQPYAAGLDVREGRPVLAAWMERVKGRLQPHFDEAHKQILRLHDTFAESKV